MYWGAWHWVRKAHFLSAEHGDALNIICEINEVIVLNCIMNPGKILRKKSVGTATRQADLIPNAELSPENGYCMIRVNDIL
jgi:hypothetical protein